MPLKMPWARREVSASPDETVESEETRRARFLAAIAPYADNMPEIPASSSQPEAEEPDRLAEVHEKLGLNDPNRYAKAVDEPASEDKGVSSVNNEHPETPSLVEIYEKNEPLERRNYPWPIETGEKAGESPETSARQVTWIPFPQVAKDSLKRFRRFNRSVKTSSSESIENGRKKLKKVTAGAGAIAAKDLNEAMLASSNMGMGLLNPNYLTETKPPRSSERLQKLSLTAGALIAASKFKLSNVGLGRVAGAVKEGVSDSMFNVSLAAKNPIETAREHKLAATVVALGGFALASIYAYKTGYMPSFGGGNHEAVKDQLQRQPTILSWLQPKAPGEHSQSLFDNAFQKHIGPGKLTVSEHTAKINDAAQAHITHATAVKQGLSEAAKLKYESLKSSVNLNDFTYNIAAKFSKNPQETIHKIHKALVIFGHGTHLTKVGNTIEIAKGNGIIVGPRVMHVINKIIVNLSAPR